MVKVELRLAYEWTCEECGVDQFEHMYVVDPSQLSPQELADIHHDFNIEPGDEGLWSIPPKEVACKKCGAKFETSMGENDE